MWTFQITFGHITNPQGAVISTDAYSGHGKYANDAKATSIQGLGPLPPGTYEIAEAINHPHLGPVAMRLTPIDVPTLGNRSGFWIHGDNQSKNHTGSDGCIVVDRATRETINASSDRMLEVIA